MIWNHISGPEVPLVQFPGSNQLQGPAGAMGSDAHVGILIVGAGPTGLGAATRLNQHGYQDWLVVDQVDPTCP